MITFAHASGVVSAAFLGSAVEAVEAMTLVLAAGIVRGWRSSLAGAASALALLAALVVAARPVLELLPVDRLQVVVGTLLLIFGLRWFRKAILRSAGAIPLHDEEAAFAESTAALGAASVPRRKWDAIAWTTAFKAVLLEGIEVVLIVIGVGAASHMIVAASVGAAAACALVVIAGLLIHKPLARVPENTLKFAVGGIMVAFGIFWFGEGLGVRWPYEDAAILGLMGIVFAAGSMAVELAKLYRRNEGSQEKGPARGP
jgi:uncharacterized membrane protein